MSNPLLIFPKPAKANRIAPKTIPPKFFHPTIEFQKIKFEQKISDLDIAIENETISISESIVGLELERVLVFEIKGDITDFYKAVEKTEGMEFLGESFVGEDDPDENFIFKRKRKESPDFDEIEKQKIPRKLFFTINNYQALTELKRYWDWYKQGNNKAFKSTSVTKFRYLFEQLNDIRYYSVGDRYEDTGILEYFHERLALNEEELFFEIELTFRNDDNYLGKVFALLKNLVEKYNGSIIESSHIVIKEIKYHAVLAKAPISLFLDLKDDTQVSFFKCEQVLFFRPVGQSVVSTQIQEESEIALETFIKEAQVIELNDDPVIALLDGLPLQNHSLLQGKIKVDDPDNIESNYPATARQHGTSMASLILYGDLNSTQVNLLQRKIYVHPILIPIYDSFNTNYKEEVPNNKLFIDIIHSAVKRIFEGSDNENPIAPNTKIINLSVGDPHRIFLYNNSSWARLIDWLSFKYNVLFVISAGNFTESIEFDLNTQFESLTQEEKEELLLDSIKKNNIARRIIAPAESLNCITVGAYNHDEFNGNFTTNSSRVELLANQNQISPISRNGLGFLKSIKPDILMPGGRQLYRSMPNSTNIYKVDMFDNAPGQSVAFPDSNGTNKGVHFSRGTSNAAALATRFGAKIHQVLEELSFENLSVPFNFYSVVIKALLVHGASKDNMDLFINVLEGDGKKKLHPYIGHGLIRDENKVLNCTEQQVTLIGHGELRKDESHIFELPLPDEVSSIQLSKKLTITLAWFSPFNFSSNKYRKAALYIDNISGVNSEETEINWQENEYDYNQSKKGTLQHLRYKGNEADAFIENSVLKIKINCREDAAKLEESIKYGLAVTFELIDNATINIYQEIRQRIAQRVRV
jgi:hypothetical protein